MRARSARGINALDAFSTERHSDQFCIAHSSAPHSLYAADLLSDSPVLKIAFVLLKKSRKSSIWINCIVVNRQLVLKRSSRT